MNEEIIRNMKKYETLLLKLRQAWIYNNTDFYFTHKLNRDATWNYKIFIKKKKKPSQENILVQLSVLNIFVNYI